MVLQNCSTKNSTLFGTTGGSYNLDGLFRSLINTIEIEVKETELYLYDLHPNVDPSISRLFSSIKIVNDKWSINNVPKEDEDKHFFDKSNLSNFTHVEIISFFNNNWKLVIIKQDTREYEIDLVT